MAVMKYWDGTQYVPIIGMDQGTTDARYVKKSGDTMTGTLQAGGGVYVQGQQRFLNASGGHRWQWYTYGSETGSNAGSDLVLGNLDDSGGYISNAVYVYRSSGAVYIPGLTPNATSNLVPSGVWTDYGSSFSGLYVTKAAGLVTVELFMKPTSSQTLSAGVGVSIASTPAGFRPGHDLYVLGYINSGSGYSMAFFYFAPAGYVQIIPWTTVTVSPSQWIGCQVTYRQVN